MSGRSEEEEDEDIYFPQELEDFYENKETKLGAGMFPFENLIKPSRK